MSFLKQRGYLLSLVAIGAILAFAACGGDEDKGTEKSPGGGTSAAGERIQGGTLTVQNLEFQSSDPHFSNFVQDISLERMLWRGLYTLDKDNKPQPAMADGDPTISTDGLTYTVKVKEGLKWSDGQPLTAKDFQLAVLRTCNPDVASNYQSFVTNIVGCDEYFGAKGTADAPKTPTAEELEGLKNGVEVSVTGNSVEFKLKTAQPTFPLLLSMWTYFPVPSHLLPDPGAKWPTPPSPSLAYNGPYMIQDYKPQDSAVLVPNPNWSAPNGIKPTLDKIVIKYIEKDDVSNNAYRNGELDVVAADIANLDAVKSEFGNEFFQAILPGTRAVEMELKHPPLDIFEFRLALSQAIDRDQMIKVCCGGAYVPTTSFQPEGVGGAAPDAFQDQIGYNPDKAKENLAKARAKFGKDFPKLTVLVRDTPEAKAQAEFVQNVWKTTLGLDTEIQQADSPTRSKRLNGHDYELAPRSGWIQDYPDPEDWGGHASGLFPTGGSNNTSSCSDPEVDALADKAQTNTNDTERREQYKKINELVTTRLCGYIPTYHEANNNIIKPYVVGMKENSTAQDTRLPGDWIAEAWGRSK